MCSKFFAATKQIEEELLLWVFLREKKERKKRNESTKRAKESEERSKEQMSEIEEKKKERDLLYYLFYSNLCMKNNVARCIRAVQKRQEVNFNNSFFYTIWFYLKSLKNWKICRAYSTYCWKQLLTEIVCCCHRLKLWRRPHYTTKSIYSQQLWQVLSLSLVLAYNLCSKLYTNSLNTSLPLHT